MAQIDPNIALGFRMPQIQDPVAATMRAQEVGVNALKMGEMQRGIASQNKLRELYSQGVDVSTPEGFKQLAAVDPSAAMKLRNDALQAQKLQGDIKETGLKISAKQMDAFRERIGSLEFNPSNANIQARLEDAVLQGEITPQEAQQRFAQATAIPLDQRPSYFRNMGVKTEERYKMNTISEADKKRIDIQQGQLDLSRQGQKLQYDPVLQGQIASAKTTAQEAAKREIAGSIDVTSNRKALAQAGYDVSTGKDDITDLIKKSTGSYIGKGVDIGGRVFGTSTAGSEALAALEQKANAITFGLLNGKLGAGISKSDAELVASLVGKLGDGTLPVNDRLAAWDSAKTMMKNLGMVAEPTGGAKPSAKPNATAPTVKTPTLPSGFTLDNPKP